MRSLAFEVAGTLMGFRAPALAFHFLCQDETPCVSCKIACRPEPNSTSATTKPDHKVEGAVLPLLIQGPGGHTYL
jgi:hypothetical protein